MTDNSSSNTEKPASPAGGNTPAMSSRQAAQRRLLAALLTADRFNDRVNKILSTSDGQERTFAFLQYTSHALHHILTSAPSLALQTRLSLLSRLRATSHPHPTPAPEKPTTTQTSPLLAFSSLMSQARFMLRLLGLPELIAWGSATLKFPPEDRIMYILTLAQVLSNLLYQFLENTAFLTMKGVIPKRFLDKYGGANKVDLWSTRFWLGHIILQYFVLWRARDLRNTAYEKDGESKEKQAALNTEVRSWKKSLVNNACWTPLCLHWSFEQGIGFPGPLVGVVSFMAGAWGFRDLWESTI
ncbi:uncharacterized protein BDV14DRAFT_167616 [Aspergillus stella-maris]|uniref:uncharacterized protein n=1 Tax=Aspergillus stella-maris TaxID=1810926 RepID=UPI003CCD08B7